MARNVWTVAVHSSKSHQGHAIAQVRRERYSQGMD